MSENAHSHAVLSNFKYALVKNLRLTPLRWVNTPSAHNALGVYTRPLRECANTG
jgi:hypothetical protein